jgi:hypothetical protein
MAWCEFMRNDFKKTSEMLEEFVSKWKLKSYQALAYYQLGISYFITGQEEKALEAWAHVEPAVRAHFTWDIWAGRKAKQYLEAKEIPLDELFYVGPVFWSSFKV